LYEELLIGKNPTSTEHPKIFMANEAYVAWTQFFSEMQQLESHLDQGDMISVFETMTGLVEGYRPHDKPVDWIYAKNVEGLDPSS